MTQQATTGAARESRAGPDRPNLSHLPLEPSPVYVQQAEERARSLENRVADQITTFAGSMRFVYLHILWFGCWIGFGAESYPFGLLTMIVSLEAIFLSTFVMISQNRADGKRQAIAEQQWQTVQEEDRQNAELLQLSHQILELTRAIHADTTPLDASSREPLSPSSGSSASRKSPSLIGVVKPCPGSSGDVVGEEFARLVVEEYREQYQELLARFCLAQAGEFTLQIRDAHGRLVPTEVSAAPLRGGGGVVGIFGSGGRLRRPRRRGGKRLDFRHPS